MTQQNLFEQTEEAINTDPDTEVAWNPESGFALACTECNDGQHIGDAAQAFEEGWVDIVFEDDGLWWTHLGWCPICKGNRGHE